MKAARWHGAKDIRVETIDEPRTGAGEVKIKVAWTGICGSDLHEYLAGPIFVPVGADHPLSHDQAPITMGHEYCGEISEVGDGVAASPLATGSRWSPSSLADIAPPAARGSTTSATASVSSVCPAAMAGLPPIPSFRPKCATRCPTN